MIAQSWDNSMNNFKRSIALFFILSISSSAFAMVYDNRFFPLYQRMYPRTREKPSNVIGDVFIMVANDAAKDNDESIGIAEVLGLYDQNKLADALVALGKPNPFDGTQFEQFIGRDMPWIMNGKLDAQGIAFAWNQCITENVSIGLSLFAMHVFHRITFQLGQNTLDLNPDQIADLDKIRRFMQSCIDLEAPKFSRGGFSDMDLYVRFGNIWDYSCKFRRIDAGISIGALVPTGLTRQINNPASVPFGGNGHWGGYVAADLEIELKEDWIFGFLFRMSKRAEKTKGERLTLAGEQPLFGALVGKVAIDPGLTFVFAPYFRIEDIRDGLGMQAKYTIVAHLDDSICDARVCNRMPQAQLGPWNNVTDWNAEYLTLNVFYDFARVRTENCFAPILSFMWDIPLQAFIIEGVSKTHRISLGLLFSF